MIFSKKPTPINYDPLFLNGKQLERVDKHCQLGMIFNETMTWSDHIREKCNTAMKRVTILKRMNLRVPRTTKLQIYISFVRPVLEYGSVLFDYCTSDLSEMLESVQRQACLAITSAYRHTSHMTLLKEVGLPLLKQRRIISKLTLFYKILNKLTPRYLRTILPDREENPRYLTRQHDDIRLPRITKNYFLKSFIPSTIRLWNKLNRNIRNIPDIADFKVALRDLYTPERAYRPYLMGYTKEYINLSRIRMGLSGLNSQRKKYHFIPESTCPTCQNRNESPQHFLLECPTYAAHRAEMVTALTNYLPEIHQLTQHQNRRFMRNLTEKLLFGTGTEEIDIKIFEIIAEYIKKTDRFL